MLFLQAGKAEFTSDSILSGGLNTHTHTHTHTHIHILMLPYLRLHLLLFFLSHLTYIHSCAISALAVRFLNVFPLNSHLDGPFFFFFFFFQVNVSPQKGFPCPPYLVSCTLFSFFMYLLDDCELSLLDCKLCKNRRLVYLVHSPNLGPWNSASHVISSL